MNALIPLAISAGVFAVGALGLALFKSASKATPEPPAEQLQLRDESHLWGDIDNLPY